MTTQSATAPHYCAAPLLTDKSCPTSSSLAAASTVQPAKPVAVSPSQGPRATELTFPANNNSLRQLPTSYPPRHQAPRLRCPGLLDASPRCEAVQQCCQSPRKVVVPPTPPTLRNGGRPATEFRQHHSPAASRRTCVGCKRTIAISITPLLSSCCDSAFHRSCSGLTRDTATAASTAEAGSAIDVQLFPQADRTLLHSPEQKFQNLHVARASPRCVSYSGTQMIFSPKCRNYVTDWQPKASMYV